MSICVDCPPCSISPSYGVFWLRGRIHEKKGRTPLVDGLPKSASPANRILTLYPYQSAPSGSQGELSLCKTHGPSNTDSLSFARWVCSDSRKWLRPFQSYEQWPRKWLVPSTCVGVAAVCVHSIRCIVSPGFGLSIQYTTLHSSSPR